MKAAAFMGIKNIKLVEIEKPEPKNDGVLIKVKACGICGSDLHVYNSDLLKSNCIIRQLLIDIIVKIRFKYVKMRESYRRLSRISSKTVVVDIISADTAGALRI